MSDRKKRPRGYSSDNSVDPSDRSRPRFTGESPRDPKGGRMVEERVINRDWQLSTIGPVQVDDPSAIGDLLLSEVKWKAACWAITYTREDGSEGPTYNGQVGLIWGERLTAKAENNPPPPGRWEVTPTTALHNVVEYPENDEVFPLSKIILPNPMKSINGVVFNNFRRSLGDADRVELIAADSVFAALEWKSVDISRGQMIKEPRNILTQKHLSFQPVPKE